MHAALVDKEPFWHCIHNAKTIVQLLTNGIHKDVQEIKNSGENFVLVTCHQ